MSCTIRRACWAARKRRGIGLRACLQAGHHAGGIVQGSGERHLAHVDGGQEGVRMAGLVEALDLAGMGIVDRCRHSVEIAIEQVDMDAADQQPATAVDPRAPAAQCRHLGRSAAIIQGGDNS